MATLTPAYGRDYKNKFAALKDWNEGKDFIYHELLLQQYVNRDDCPAGRHKLRYSNLRKVIVINHQPGADRDKAD